jgi:hypothetical protein
MKTVALLVILALCSCQAPYSTCWKGDSDCPNPCPQGSHGNLSFTSTLMFFDLVHNKEFVTNMVKAQSLIKNHSSHEIIRFDQPLLFHSSLNCKEREHFVLIVLDFCCYSAKEKLEIMKVLLKYEHKPLHVNWTTTCLFIVRKRLTKQGVMLIAMRKRSMSTQMHQKNLNRF